MKLILEMNNKKRQLIRLTLKNNTKFLQFSQEKKSSTKLDKIIKKLRFLKHLKKQSIRGDHTIVLKNGAKVIKNMNTQTWLLQFNIY